MARWKVLVALGAAILAPWVPSQAEIEPELLAGMKARSIGPAGMSGRVAALEAVEASPEIIYVGAATGGVWKSVNGGLTWVSIFDEQPVAAVGAVAIFQPNPDIVWVGTGEGNPRNSVSVGNGIYRSLDAGETWTHLGLENTERIHRIVLHPTDPDVAWVAALGRAWGENAERGVFKTVDGGKTWSKVLYVDERTGASDLVIDPSNPNKLIAGMWDYRRWPWFFRSGGPGSGLYRTFDGGESWKRLGEEDGLPSGELGRIGVAFCRSHPEIVYALVEAEKGALLRSDDGGSTWVAVNEEPAVARRPFYFADVRVDPQWPHRVYSLWSLLSVSDDGGKSFDPIAQFRHVHPDHHAMWINPADPDHLLVGNDGGVVVSRDRGKTWQFVSNLPLAQYYHIAVDTDVPYNVYGGMQDNGSWRGPSEVWENGGIRNHHWEEVGFGDGFDTRPDPDDSMTGYAMSQEGYLRRWNLHNGERKDIRPPAPEGEELRFNWNAAFAIDPFDSRIIYYGSQFVHRSPDRGETWSIMSPDMTTDNPEWQKQAESGGLTLDVTGAENFTSIVAITPSPVERGVIWVGTDDGRLWVTNDGGDNWQDVERNVKGVPENTWIPHIEPSRFSPDAAFVVFDNHRRSDWTPYVYRTSGYGKKWTRLATEGVRGYALSIVQDLVDKDLLFLGTEFGLWVSMDGGGQWVQWTHGFPTVSAMDLVIHPVRHDLVIGTHGRGAYVLDDVHPLRGLDASILAKPIHLFDVPDAQQHRVKQTGASRFPGHGEFRGANRPYGTLITFSLGDESLPTAEEMKRREETRARVARSRGKSPGEDDADVAKVIIRIRDDRGKLVRTFERPVHRGINRVTWDLRRDAFKEPPRERPWWRSEGEGPELLPGKYTLEIEFDGRKASQLLRVRPDPRFEITDAARAAKWEAILRTGGLQETVATAVERVTESRSDIDVVVKKRRAELKLRDDDSSTAEEKEEDGLIESAKVLKERLETIERRLWVPPDTRGIVAETAALSKIDYVMRSLTSSWDAPTPAQTAYLDRATTLATEVVGELNDLFATDVAAFRIEVESAAIDLLPEESPIETTR